MLRIIPLCRWLAALAAILLTACQSATVTSSFPPVAAPKLAVGDHWQYRITDNLRRGAVTMLDAEVVSITGGTATLRLVYTEPTGRSEAAEEIDASGGLVVGALKEERTRRFPTPLEMYQFPLQAGQSWRQTVDTTSPETQLNAQILVYGTVQSQTQTTVPGGSFDAIYLYRIIQLDDEQFWRTRTSRRDSVWFAPQAKGVARETRDASYTLFGGGVNSVVRTENTTRELLSFRPGA
jgi:hypothetical protein